MQNIENNPEISKIISSLSGIMGGAEVSEADIESLIQKTEIFEAYTGIIIRKNNMGEYSHGLIGLQKEGFAKYSMATNETATKNSAKPSIDNIPHQASIVNINSMPKTEKNSEKHISESAGKLTYDDERVILKYKSSDSYIINEKLYKNEPLSASEKRFVEDLNKALDKMPNFTGKVYRNITFYFQGKEIFDEFVNSHIVGEKSVIMLLPLHLKLLTVMKLMLI